MSPSLKQRLLGSSLVWRLSGLTLATSIRATRGAFLSPEEYLARSGAELEPFEDYLDGRRSALEFGCGPGGILLSLRDRVSMGIGLDINALYIWQARRLARRTGATNLRFLSYDGSHLPIARPEFDLILAFGTFERIPRPQAEAYFRALTKCAKTDAVLLLYLLEPGARDSTLVQTLGEAAYTYWQPDLAERSLSTAGLEVVKQVPSGMVESTDGRGSVHAGQVYVCRPRR